MPYADKSRYVLASKAIPEIARCYFDGDTDKAADDALLAAQDGELRISSDESIWGGATPFHQIDKDIWYRNSINWSGSWRLYFRRADLLKIYPDLWKPATSAVPPKARRGGRKEGSGSFDAADTLAGIAETAGPPAVGQTQGQSLDNERGQSVGAATDDQPLSPRDQRKQETQARYGCWHDRYRELKAANKSRRRIEIARMISKEERKAGNLKATPETIKRRLDEDDRVGRLRTGQKKTGQ